MSAIATKRSGGKTRAWRSAAALGAVMAGRLMTAPAAADAATGEEYGDRIDHIDRNDDGHAGPIVVHGNDI